MIKKIFSLLVLAAGSVYLASCDNDEDFIETFTSLVDVSNTALSEEKYNMVTLYSTDGGTTFVEYPKVKKGDTYMAKVVHRGDHGDEDVTSETCYDVDWSGSNPQPNSVTGGVAEFTMGPSGQLLAKVAVQYDASAWAGTITALEDYGSATWGPYEVTLTQDATNPNRFHLDNFYDSGLEAYIDFDPSGSVSFPDGQSPGGKPITNSSGSFNQCSGTLEINLNYDGGDWVYHFTK